MIKRVLLHLLWYTTCATVGLVVSFFVTARVMNSLLN